MVISCGGADSGVAMDATRKPCSFALHTSYIMMLKIHAIHSTLMIV
jgi:hypothetical protein